MSRTDWRTFEARPRRAVQGGVAVAKPGKVSDPVAADLLEAAAVETSSGILARGRTYARAGQLLEVSVGTESFTAKVQGSAAQPYRVSLGRTTISGSPRIAAGCSCPYGCDYDWCKHAAALAYVAAYLIDRDAAVRTAWTGEPPQQDAPGEPGVALAGDLVVTDDDLAVLRSPAPPRSATALLLAADAVVPLPPALRATAFPAAVAE